MISLSIGFRLNEFQKVSVSMLLFPVSVILEVDMVSGLSTRVWMGSCCDSPSVGSPPRVSPLSWGRLHCFFLYGSCVRQLILSFKLIDALLLTNQTDERIQSEFDSKCQGFR